MNEFARFARYFIAGGTAALCDIGLFLLLLDKQLSVQAAGSIAFIVATFVNYIFSRYFVFPDRKGSGIQKIIGTYIASGVGLLLNQLILWFGIMQLHQSPLLSKLAATGLVFFWNYFIRNYYVFKNRQ